MNNSANTANAARNTALFHIGRRPSRTPEKMKPGKLAAKRRGGGAACCVAFVAIDAEATGLFDTATFSVCAAAPENVCGPVSGDPFDSEDIVSVEGGAFLRLAGTAR